ncbi:unnamed protein product [Didymodactylos carnosus]|uniref:PPIase cyclophilin-type domain-containing protein n=1 Tax=Didymodactylos carnosus TaxID=1234261 RepID=A0A813UYF8_9BILA|nr:unnamed protein product [Didymodactylos carnosus]CAF1095851.1 unnamed protein product [Didymodactylos carnosus]CAF3621230.1 unnamed protein product [Didymodactylos carnosus]CAF3857274.1 unnamed protein product [Didymodactylos carnosus]
MAPGQSRVAVFGLLNSENYRSAKSCLEDLKRTHPSQFKSIDFHPLLEFEWKQFLKSKKAELRGETWSFIHDAMVFIDDQLLGGSEQLQIWAQSNFGYGDFRAPELLAVLSNEEYVKRFHDSGNSFVFMDFVVEDRDGNSSSIGRLIFELFNDAAPKTCENFYSLCTGEKDVNLKTGNKLHYKNTIIHRIVPNGWIQGGDTWGGRGNGGESIYGETFEDESFIVPHDRRGVLGMANKGIRHSNGSQFYITLSNACNWMDKRFVAFGHIIEGFSTLAEIERIETLNQRPIRTVRIVDSGAVNLDHLDTSE